MQKSSDHDETKEGELMLPTIASRQQDKRRRLPAAQQKQQPLVSRRVSTSPRQRIADEKPLPNHVLAGLTTAGVAATILTTLFAQVTTIPHTSKSADGDEQQNNKTYTFPSYDSGARVALLTIASLSGAWWFDQQTTTNNNYKRSDWIGAAGMVLTAALVVSCFVLADTEWLYEACFAIFTIVLASTATDDHRMSYNTRAWFQMSSEIWNWLSTLAVMVVSILFLDNDRNSEGSSTMLTDQWIMLFIVVFALTLFVAAQNMILGLPLLSVKSIIPKRKKVHDEDVADPKQVRLQRSPAIREILQSPSFRAWIGMEMLLEAQVLFQTAFLPTFLQRLIEQDERGSGTEWLEPATKPVRQLVGILFYLPLRRFGYIRIYTFLFLANLTASLLVMNFGDYTSTKLIYPLLFAFPIISGAVLNCGFQFVMADMALEIKHKRATRGNVEPSVAALLLGLNALFCKPMKHVFVIAAKTVLHRSGSRVNAFLLLISIPMVCSLLQLFFWSGYGLTPRRVLSMREELQRAFERLESSGQLTV